MALHLNLHHEIQKAKKLKRRDPLKLSIFGLSAIAAAFAIYYFVELGRMHGFSQQLSKIQAEFSALEPKAQVAAVREEEINAQISKSALMSKRIEERFYWAPVLEQLAQVVPREVQITRLVGDVTGDSLRKCSLTIEGLSAGADPRKVAEELRTTIADKFGKNYKSVSSNFKTLEDGTELVMLDGRQMPTAIFAINVQITAGEEPAPAPVRSKKI